MNTAPDNARAPKTQVMTFQRARSLCTARELKPNAVSAPRAAIYVASKGGSSIAGTCVSLLL
jgi:hypothetical protein